MDSRADITIKFSIYGRDFSKDFSINWTWDDEFGGLDRRVAEWFLDCHRVASKALDLGGRKVSRYDLKEHDRVQAVCGIPGDGALWILPGEKGVVISVHKMGEAYTVEFFRSPSCSSIVTVRAESIEKIK